MPALMEAALEHLNRLVDIMGYLLMMVLSMILWWGIYSGVEITASAQQKQVLAPSENPAKPEATLSSVLAWQETPWSRSDETHANSWSMAAGL